MPRNVEIKARMHDKLKIVSIVSQLSGNNGEEIIQEDTFYNAVNGRLKLRRYGDEDGLDLGTLVYYDRPDAVAGTSNVSEYELCGLSTEQTNKIDKILSTSLGVKGIIKKKRLVFMVGQTRVHIDCVQDLGDFMELEVVLRPEQTAEEGQSIANQLQIQLGVKQEDLLSGAYMDLVLKS